MASLTPKERAILLSRHGHSNEEVAAILGVDLTDVQALMLEADPDVDLPGGSDVGVPALQAIPVSVPSGNVPDIDDVDGVWDELFQITAPTDAASYWFKVLVNLVRYDATVPPDPTAYVFATDADGFADWWDHSTVVPGVECQLRGPVTEGDVAYLRTTLQLPVGPGQVLGLAQDGRGGVTSDVSWFEAGWIPVV